MKGCLGCDCPTSCCGTKETWTYNQGAKSFNTSLDSMEYQYQIERHGPMPAGVKVERVDTGYDGPPRISYLVSGCLADDGSCKLNDRKPAQCRVYPLHTGILMPLIDSCPQAHIIGADVEVQTGVKRIREAFNLDHGEEWAQNLARYVRELTKKRTRTRE